jgi:hypothetical protein
VGDLALLLHLERGCPKQPLLEALFEHRCGDGPTELADAADRLVRMHAPWALDAGPAIAALLEAAGDDRSRRLFAASSLGRDQRSLEQLADGEGISGQRTGKIVHQAGARVREALSRAPAPFPWLVAAVRRRLGGVTTQEQADVVLARLGVVGNPGTELLLWLAGPYHPVPGHSGWLATHPRLVAPLTSRCLSADGGVRRLVDVEAELAEIDVPANQLVPWLRACAAIVVHDLVVSVAGPVADVVERVLDAHGVAQTVDEIQADLGDGGREVPLATLDRTMRSRRFVRTGDGSARLATWAEDARRSAPMASSRRRRAAPPPAPAIDAPPGGERLWLWVRVDTDALHGSEAAVPAALVEGVGLAPLTRRTFSSRWGPVTLAHDGPQPTRGSVRAVALAAGARLDDTLLLGFSPAGDAVVEVRRASGQASKPDSTGDTATFSDALTGGTQ